MVQSVLRAGAVTAVTLLIGSILCAVAAGHADAARATCRGKVATIVGTPGNDDIVGTAKADVILGGGGTDSIYGGAGDDIICGGRSGVRVEEGENVPQSLSGGPGDDVIVGGPGGDFLGDTEGVDLLLGRGGLDVLSAEDRGPGRDGDVLRGGSGPDQLFSHQGADHLYGGRNNDVLQGGLNDNVLRGGEGDDRIDSGGGNDTIDGGPGIDVGAYINARGRPSVSSPCSDVSADLSSGVASGKGFGVDTLEGVENLASGGGNDVLVGNSANNTFYVGYAFGVCYEDRVLREAVTGGGGWDRISFDSGYWQGISPLGPVVVDLAAGTAEQGTIGADAAAVGGITLDSIENVTGTEYADTILGDNGPNRFSAGPSPHIDGGDVMRGRGGDDRLTGSVGPDDLYGDEGADQLVGHEGNDHLDGGMGTNAIDGGKGRDTCQNPDQYNGALNCEA